jgi:hypothetical protein
VDSFEIDFFLTALYRLCDDRLLFKPGEAARSRPDAVLYPNAAGSYFTTQAGVNINFVNTTVNRLCDQRRKTDSFLVPTLLTK